MAFDNPRDAFRQQYMQEEPSLPNKLARYAAEAGFKLAIPDGGLAAEILMKVVETLFDKAATVERVNTFFELVCGEFDHIEKTKANHDDVQKAIQIAIWYDRHERDNAKSERYVKLIGNARYKFRRSGQVVPNARAAGLVWVGFDRVRAERLAAS